MEQRITIRPDQRADFTNNADFCVGTGRLGLGLQAEYQEQLRAVQAQCHFRYIRGHGLFHDDMSIFERFPLPDGTWQEGYNFTYLDRLFDSWRAAGLKTPEQVMSASKGPRGFPPGDAPYSIREKIVFH